MTAPVRVTSRDSRVWAFRSEPLILVSLLVLLSALAFRFPPSGDDWAWGTALGMDRLESRFDGYNGRWLGNFAVLFLTRATVLAPVVVAATLCLIVRLLVGVAGIRTPAGYLAATALILAMPLGEWRQTIVWVSGFSNYALASVGMLLFILCAQQEWGRGWKTPGRVAAGAFVIAVASQLFIEHVSLYLLVASLVNVGLLLMRHRSALVSTAWAVGALLGAALMFSNSAYRAATQGSSNYQSVGSDEGGLRGIVEQGTGGVSQLAVTENTGWNTSFLVLLAVLAGVQTMRGRLNWQQIGSLCAAGLGVVGSAAVASSPDGTRTFGALTPWSWLPALGILVAVVLCAISLVKSRERSILILTLAGSVIVLVGPLAVLNPYGPRNFLPPYLLLVAISLVLLAEIADQIVSPLVSSAVAAIGLSVSLALFGGYFAVYTDISNADDERIDLIREAVNDGKSKVEVFDLPHAGYVHNPDPDRPIDFGRFLQFHGLPEDLVVEFKPR